MSAAFCSRKSFCACDGTCSKNVKTVINVFFSIQYKVYNDKLPKTVTTKHYITLQGRYQKEQRYYDYPLAFNTEHMRPKIQLIYDTKCYLTNTNEDFTD